MACKKCKKRLLTRFFFWLIDSLRFWDRILTSTNWKATWYWSLQKHQFFWIGKGYNPDYTQACITGTCAGDTSGCQPRNTFCGVPFDCGQCATTGSCGCPAPLPNSSQTSPCSQSCSPANTNCAGCSASKCGTPSCLTISCSVGTCGFNCNPGYTWNGSACVASTMPGFDPLFMAGD